MVEKIDFLAHFESFFVYNLVDPMRSTPRVYQMNAVIKIYICGKFHHYSICGCDIKNFQSVLCWFSVHEMSHFCDFLGSYSPKYCLT